jgi:hypothetical protein
MSSKRDAIIKIAAVGFSVLWFLGWCLVVALTTGVLYIV